MSPLSPTSEKPGGPYRKPRADVFTVLLVIALVALILGIVCLYAEMEAYQWKFDGGPTVTGIVPAEPAGDLAAAVDLNRPAPCAWSSTVSGDSAGHVRLQRC